MNKTENALKLALDCVSTLANARDWVGCNPNERWDEDEMYAELCNATICLKKSLSIIQEALAEQPTVKQSLTVEQPAQQQVPERMKPFVQRHHITSAEFTAFHVGFCCGEEFNKQLEQQQEPVALDVTIEGDSAKLLAAMLEPVLDEEPIPIRLLVGNGHSGHGLYVAAAEYQDEGAALLVNTSPPASKLLTDEQWQVIADTLGCFITRSQKDTIEYTLGIKEKNNG